MFRFIKSLLQRKPKEEVVMSDEDYYRLRDIVAFQRAEEIMSCPKEEWPAQLEEVHKRLLMFFTGPAAEDGEYIYERVKSILEMCG